MESKYFLKKLNSRTKFVIGIIFIIISIFFEYLVISDYKEESKNAKPYTAAKSSGEYVYVDVTEFTDYFATYSDGDTKQYYHFLYDGKYLYIGKVKPSTYNKLPGRIYGYTTAMPSELVSIAIDEYNSYAGEEIVNSENIYETFGVYYINNYKTPIDDLIGFSIIIGILFIVGIILVIIDITNKSKTKKEIKKYDIEKILKEIDSKNTISNHRGKLYLTEKNIISYSSKLDVINYEDVVWIYPHTQKYRGTTSASIMVMDKNGKNHSICFMTLIPKTNIEFDEVYVDLRNKLPHSLYGYTQENMEKANDVVNKYKLK